MTAADFSRQTGLTTRQMLKAPAAAIFVWCTNSTYYPASLAQHIGRNDLRVVPRLQLCRLDEVAWRKQKLVIDHALGSVHRLTRSELEAIGMIRHFNQLVEAEQP